jgi:hypothetical protein
LVVTLNPSIIKTDGYLVDNINDAAGGRAKEIIDNYTVI